MYNFQLEPVFLEQGVKNDYTIIVFKIPTRGLKMKASAILIAATLTFASSLHAHDNYNIRSPAPAENGSKHESPPQGYREIQTEALSRLVHSAHPSAIIVDSRSPQYDNGKRIPGAKVLPVNSPVEIITAILPDKEVMVVVYCSKPKCPASGLLADRLVHMGYKNVWKYPGGIEEWEASGQKIEMGKTALETPAKADQ